jgi:hypothetical protein
MAGAQRAIRASAYLNPYKFVDEEAAADLVSHQSVITLSSVTMMTFTHSPMKPALTP